MNVSRYISTILGAVTSIASLAILGIFAYKIFQKSLINNMYTKYNTDFLTLSIVLSSVIILSGLLLYLGKSQDQSKDEENKNQCQKINNILCVVFGIISTMSFIAWFPVFMPKMLEQLSTNKVIEGMPIVILAFTVIFSVVFFALTMNFMGKEKNAASDININVQPQNMEHIQEKRSTGNERAVIGYKVLPTDSNIPSVNIQCACTCHANMHNLTNEQT